MKAYKITKENINNNDYWFKIINETRNSLSKLQTIDNKILLIKIVDIVDDNNEMILKLEFKNS